MEPLSLSNRYKVRCAQITSQESIYSAESLSRTRLSLSMACYLGEGITQHTTLTIDQRIPCVLPRVQYIR